MVGLQEEYRNAMDFLWARDKELKTVELFRMTCNTFGVKDAQFNIISVIREHAQSLAEAYRRAANVLNSDLYMDDLLTGAPTEVEVLQLKQEVIEILSKAGMEIKKWRVGEQREH